MPHDPVVLDAQLIEGGFARPDTVLIKQYEAPADAEGEIAEDPYRDADMALAQKMKEWLEKRYVGYLWSVKSDLAQKMAYIQLGILMGPNDWYAINLVTTELASGLVDGAGELLERYNLPRTEVDVARWLEARQKHSRLIMPWARIPV